MGERGSRGGWAGGQGHRGAWTAEGPGSPPQHWLPGDMKSPGGPTYHLERQGDFVEMWEEPQAGEPLGRRKGGPEITSGNRLALVACWRRPGSVQDPVPLLESPLGARWTHTPVAGDAREWKPVRDRVGGTGAAWAWQPRPCPKQCVVWHGATGLHPASTRMQTEVDFIVWGRACGKYS